MGPCDSATDTVSPGKSSIKVPYHVRVHCARHAWHVPSVQPLTIVLNVEDIRCLSKRRIEVKANLDVVVRDTEFSGNLVHTFSGLYNARPRNPRYFVLRSASATKPSKLQSFLGFVLRISLYLKADSPSIADDPKIPNRRVLWFRTISRPAQIRHRRKRAEFYRKIICMYIYHLSNSINEFSSCFICRVMQTIRWSGIQLSCT